VAGSPERRRGPDPPRGRHDGTALTKNICDGGGFCVQAPDEDCAPYTCAGNDCGRECASDKDCASGVLCKNNKCGAVPNGRGPCAVATAAAADDCVSGFCADGVCCNQLCDGECESCNQPSHLGICAAIGGGFPHRLCKTESAASCGRTGLCEVGGSCAYYPEGTICIPASCTDGNMLINTATCDGMGVCQASGLIACARSMRAATHRLGCGARGLVPSWSNLWPQLSSCPDSWGQASIAPPVSRDFPAKR